MRRSRAAAAACLESQILESVAPAVRTSQAL